MYDVSQTANANASRVGYVVEIIDPDSLTLRPELSSALRFAQNRRDDFKVLPAPHIHASVGSFGLR